MALLCISQEREWGTEFFKRKESQFLDLSDIRIFSLSVLST